MVKKKKPVDELAVKQRWNKLQIISETLQVSLYMGIYSAVIQDSFYNESCLPKWLCNPSQPRSVVGEDLQHRELARLAQVTEQGLAGSSFPEARKTNSQG